MESPFRFAVTGRVKSRVGHGLLTSAALALAAVAACGGTVSAGTVYDAQTSIAAAAAPGTPYNTAGQFSLGTYSASMNPATFSLFTNSGFSDNVGGTGMDYINSGTTDPNFIINDTYSTQTISGFTLAPTQIAAGPYQGPTVLRFTAPTTGIYQVSSNFTDIQNVNSAPQGEVFHNGMLLGSGTAVSGTGYSYTSPGLFLSAGDTVDFVTDSQGNAHNATTRVSATLTATPEPASLLLLGFGALGLLASRSRPRKA